MNEAVSALAAQEMPLPEKREEETAAMLPLDAPERVVCYRLGGKQYRHVFQRITADNVESFFANVGMEVKQEKKGITRLMDFDSAHLALYRKAVLRVEGFATKDGRAPHELKTWPECVPVNHRILAAEHLPGAYGAEGDQLLEAEGVSVMLNAKWNQSVPGEMNVYTGLVHRFASPTAEHYRKIVRARNRTFVAGGSRTGTTILPSSYGVVVALYDELIESVDGYSVGGRALSGKPQIAREMDGFHKNVAISMLFPTAIEPDEAGTEE